MQMDNKERIAKLKEKNYQKIFGVKKEIFDEMHEILEIAFKQQHIKGGRPSKLSVLDKLVIFLGYYRDYRTMENIAFEYGVSKSTICESIKWAEETLIQSRKFNLSSKRALINNPNIEIVIVDATECEIERPKKNKSNIIQERKRNIH